MKAAINPTQTAEIIRLNLKVTKLQANVDKLDCDCDQYVQTILGLQDKVNALQDFCIWLTGCGYDFCQNEYFIQQRDKLLKDYKVGPFPGSED
jgi:hypothetical protein